MKTIKYPLNNNKQYFDTTDDYMSLVKENIKQMFLTGTEDRVIRRSKIGIPLVSIFFENEREDSLELIKTSLQENLNRYFSTIRVDYVVELNSETNQDTNMIDLEVKFTDTILNISDKLVLSTN